MSSGKPIGFKLNGSSPATKPLGQAGAKPATAFSIAPKKTPFQKHKEQLEAKRKQAEDEAAKVYADFVESFGSDTKQPKAFLKGETIVPTVLLDESPVVKVEEQPDASANRVYQPTKKANDVVKVEEVKQSRAEDAKKDDKNSKKKKNIDSFLEELDRAQREKEEKIKREQEEKLERERRRQAMLAARAESNAHDSGDPNTTNVYIGNLNPQVDEGMLGRLFAKYGPIGSVKIMWPRTAEEFARNRNSGFIAFMERKDGQNAIKAMDGYEILGYPMRVGWGKSVPLPDKPMNIPLDDDPSLELPSGRPFNAQMVQYKSGGFALPPKNGPIPAGPRFEIKVRRPKDPKVLKLIHRFVEHVIIYGSEFEAVIMDKEWENPRFQFLFKNDHPEHLYYRWKLFSILQYDSKYAWRTERFFMFAHGSEWVPPSCSNEAPESEDEAPPEEDKDQQIIKGTLGEAGRKKLEQLLKDLTLQRERIAEAMVFCIEQCEAADEIVDMLCSNLFSIETPVPDIILRMYLISDVLHNCASRIKNVWKLRKGLETKLPSVFASLHSTLKSINARLRAEQLKRAVSSLLRVWESWLVFPQSYIDDLEIAFFNGSLASSDGNDGATQTAEAAAKIEAAARMAEGKFQNTFQSADELSSMHSESRKRSLPVATTTSPAFKPISKWERDDDESETVHQQPSNKKIKFSFNLNG